MTVPGREILADLRSRLDQSREETANVRREYEAVDRQVDEYVERRGEAIVELARHDLPDISQTTIEQTYAEIRDDLRSILARKERAQTELQGRLERFHTSIEELRSQSQALADRLNQLVAKRTELEQLATEKLNADVEFQPLSQQALHAEMQLKANEERSEELLHEAVRKLPPYRGSRLFQYLYQRKFGTPEYVHKGWTRSLDRWLARLINYERNRRGYEFLRNTPSMVAAEVERRKNDFNALMERVEAIEDRVSDEVGLTEVLREGAAQGSEHDKLISKLSDEQAHAQQIEAELQGLDQQQGRFYADGLERYVRFLSETETTVLESRARQTVDPADDEIVSRIAWLTREIERLQPELSRMDNRSQEAEQKSEGLSFVVRRAEQANLDSDRCTAKDVAGIERDLDRFAAGAMNQNDLWNSIRDQLDFEPTWVESTAIGAGKALNHPVSHVLLNALAHAAVTTLSQASQSRPPSYPRAVSESRSKSAHRSVARRAPVVHARRVETSRPSPSKRFTTRGGF